MRRRTALAAGSALLAPAAGCLAGSTDDDPSEAELREAACSHFPADADSLTYETAILRFDRAPLIVDGWFVDGSLDEDGTPFALVAAPEDVETRLRLDALDESDEDQAEIRAFVTETDFESEALLAWQTTTPSAGYRLDIVGVDRPENDLLHAYTCRYHSGGGNGTAETSRTVLIRVTVPERPRRAKLTFREGGASGELLDETTYEDSRE